MSSVSIGDVFDDCGKSWANEDNAWIEAVHRQEEENSMEIIVKTLQEYALASVSAYANLIIVTEESGAITIEGLAVPISILEGKRRRYIFKLGGYTRASQNVGISLRSVYVTCHEKFEPKSCSLFTHSVHPGREVTVVGLMRQALFLTLTTGFTESPWADEIRTKLLEIEKTTEECTDPNRKFVPVPQKLREYKYVMFHWKPFFGECSCYWMFVDTTDPKLLKLRYSPRKPEENSSDSFFFQFFHSDSRVGHAPEPPKFRICTANNMYLAKSENKAAVVLVKDEGDATNWTLTHSKDAGCLNICCGEELLYLGAGSDGNVVLVPKPGWTCNVARSVTIAAAGHSTKATPEPTKIQLSHSDPLVVCARMVSHEYIAGHSKSLAESEQVTRTMIDNPKRYLEQMVNKASPRHKEVQPLVEAALSTQHVATDAEIKAMLRGGSSSVASTLSAVKQLQPYISLNEVFDGWRKLMEASAKQRRRPGEGGGTVVDAPPVTRFFYSALPAITHIGMSFTHFTSRATYPWEKKSRFMNLWSVICGFIAGKDDMHGTRVGEEYETQIIRLAAMLDDAQFAYARKIVMEPSRYKEISIEMLYQDLLDFEVKACARNSVAAFQNQLVQTGRQANQESRGGYHYLYRTALLVAELQNSIRRIRLVGFYGQQNVGKSSLLQRLTGFCPPTLSAEVHTVEPSSYELTPSAGYQATGEVVLALDLPGVNNVCEERARLQAIILPALSAIFVLHRMTNGANQGSLAAQQLLDRHLPRWTPMVVLLVMSNKRFVEIVNAELSRSKMPIPCQVLVDAPEDRSLGRLVIDFAVNNECYSWQLTREVIPCRFESVVRRIKEHVQSRGPNRVALSAAVAESGGTMACRTVNTESSVDDGVLVFTKVAEGNGGSPPLHRMFSHDGESSPQLSSLIQLRISKSLADEHRTAVVRSLKKRVDLELLAIAETDSNFSLEWLNVMREAINAQLAEEAPKYGNTDWFRTHLRYCFDTDINFKSDTEVELSWAPNNSEDLDWWTVADLVRDYHEVKRAPTIDRERRLALWRTLCNEARSTRVQMKADHSSVFSRLPDHMFQVFAPKKYDREFEEIGEMVKVDDTRTFATGEGQSSITSEAWRAKFANLSCQKVINEVHLRLLLGSCGWTGKVDKPTLELLCGRVCPAS